MGNSNSNENSNEIILEESNDFSQEISEEFKVAEYYHIKTNITEMYTMKDLLVLEDDEDEYIINDWYSSYDEEVDDMADSDEYGF